MYVFVKHVNESYITRTCFLLTNSNNINLSSFYKKRIMTTYVCVMYVFDKHVHALNLFVISTLTVDFSYHVRVWHLILKKNCISLTGNKKATFFL